MKLINKQELPQTILPQIPRNTEERHSSNGGPADENLKLESLDVVEIAARREAMSAAVEEEDDKRRGGDADDEERERGERETERGVMEAAKESEEGF